MYRKYSAESVSWRNCSTNCSCATLLQKGLEAPSWGHTATGPAIPNLVLYVLPGSCSQHPPRCYDRWHSPSMTSATCLKRHFLSPTQQTLSWFCDLLFTLSGNLGRREHQMPPTMPPQLLIGATTWIPRYCLGPSGSDSCRSTVCQARVRAEGSEDRIEPSTVTLGSWRLTALIIYSSIIRSKSK